MRDLIERLDHRRGLRAIVRRAEDPDCESIVGKAFRERREMLGRPALGGAEFRTRAQDRDRLPRREPERAHRRIAIGRVGHEPRYRRGANLGIALVGERRVALDEPRQRTPVELACLREQAVARLADVTDALRDAREEGNERRLPRVRQHERARVAAFAQRPAERATPSESELAVRGRVVEDAPDAFHARVDGPAPRRRQHVDRLRDAALAQARDERLGQDGIADPRRGDDEDAVVRRDDQ